MSLNKDEAIDVIKEFVKSYPVAKYLHFQIVPNVAALHGESEKDLHVSAAYTSYFTPKQGFLGRVDLGLNTASDKEALNRSLRHEILGHYGLNTFSPTDKRLLLDSIINSRTSLQAEWSYVDRLYGNAPPYLKAEEIYAKAAENVQPEFHNTKDIKKNGEISFRLVCQFHREALSLEHLGNIVLMVAKGISDRSRQQLTLPTTDLTNNYSPQQTRPISLVPPELDLEP